MSASPLLAAPHRPLFLAGSLVAILAMAWWLPVHFLPAALAAPTTLVPAQMHGFVMLYGIFPFFMAGFILTAGPKWLGVEPPARPLWLAVVGLMASGILLFLLGGHLGRPLALSGVLLYTVGWSALTLGWLGLIRHSQAADKSHARAILLAFALGTAGLATAVVWLAAGDGRWWLVSRSVALYGFLLPVFLTVSHRMLPFFSAGVLTPYSAWRPHWLLQAFVLGSLLHGAGELLSLNTVLVDAAFAILLGYTSWRWQLLASLRVKLLAMLHLAFAWCGLAFALSAVRQGLALSGGYLFGLAPLHALTVGFFATMLIGFATRVTLGHSGRPLVASRLLWLVYLAMHAVALARVAADLLPLGSTALMLIAAIGWLLALLVWGSRVVPIYLAPRADGKAG